MEGGGREGKKKLHLFPMRDIKKQFILLGEGIILLLKGICNNHVP